MPVSSNPVSYEPETPSFRPMVLCSKDPQLQVVFAIQRYWPAVSAAISTLDRIGRFLQKSPHCSVRILTAQWEEHWPTQLIVRDVPVTRFPVSQWSLLPKKPLGTRIADWLRQHPDQWDRIVVVGNLENAEDIFAVAHQLNRPVMVQVMESGPLTIWERPDIQLKHHRKFQYWYAERNWLVPDRTTRQRILEKNPTATCAVWNLGLPDPPSDFSLKSEIRHALIAAHPVLRSSRFLPLIVYDGTYDDPQPCQWIWELISQLCQAENSNFRLWLCGEGPGLSRIYHSLVSQGWEQNVFLPGYFSCKEDLYLAADLVLLPDVGRATSFDFLTALSVGTPVIFGEQRPVLQVLESLNWFPPERRQPDMDLPEEACTMVDRMYRGRNPEDWTSGIQHYLSDPECWDSSGHWLADALSRQLPYSDTLQRYLGLLEALGE